MANGTCVTEHRLCAFLGDLTSLLTLTRPESRRYYYPYLTDEKDEAQGQNLPKVLESVTDETQFGLKSESSIVCLTGGWYGKCLEYVG